MGGGLYTGDHASSARADAPNVAIIAHGASLAIGNHSEPPTAACWRPIPDLIGSPSNLLWGTFMAQGRILSALSLSAIAVTACSKQQAPASTAPTIGINVAAMD